MLFDGVKINFNYFWIPIIQKNKFMRVKILLFCLLVTGFRAHGQESQIIMSSIGNQEVYEGARITVFFSSLKHFNTIDFSSPDIPEFGTLINDGNGEGRFFFDPTTDDVGEYTITLDVTSGNLAAEVKFNLIVREIPNDATVYYIDPLNGAESNPGTAALPFLTLESFLTNNITQINGNTFCFLRTGFHGSPFFQGFYNTPVHVLAERMHTPFMKRLNFFLTKNWYVSGLNISPETNNEIDNSTLVNVSSGSKNITITNCKIYSIEDASIWTTNEEWYEGCGDGIISSGKFCVYKNNYLKNTWFSVELRQNDSEFSYNIINWFGADAIRALDNNQKVMYNQIKNATVFDYYHPTRPQHDDGIQSWTFGAPVKNLRIIGNQIADITDPNLPLPTEIMQGIVDFDGFAEDWVVENNLVITHHPHGIALYGAKNCKITNNTVVRNPLNMFSPSSKPWIRINPRKEDVGGDLSTGNLVRNNIMATYQTEGKEPGTADFNIIGTTYNAYFADYNAWNFYLAENSPARNAGLQEDAPNIDLDKKRRIIGEIDAGCFEYGASLTDREAPTTPANISTDQISETSMTLSWDLSQDNVGIAYYRVKVGSQVIKVINPPVVVTKLNPSTLYEITIQAFDYFGNSSPVSLYEVSTSALEMLSIYFVAVDPHDQLIKSNQQLMWVGMPLHRVGGYFGEYDASVVLPFKLPCLTGDREIVSADLKVTLNEIINNPTGNVDLYGLGNRSNSCVLANDHWQGLYGQDPNAVALIGGYLTPNSSNGLISLNEGQQVSLGTYLQDLFDQGASCNEFVYLRLNSGVEQETDNAYYSIHSGESRQSEGIPLLSIVTSGTVGVKVVEIKDGIGLFPNPTTGNTIHLDLNKFEAAPVVVVIHNAKGQEVLRKNIGQTSNDVTINIPRNLNPGFYFVTVLGQQKYAQTKLIIH